MWAARASWPKVLAALGVLASVAVLASREREAPLSLGAPQIPVQPTSRVAAAEPAPPPACRETITDDELAALPPDERMLGTLWRVDHPCEAMPACVFGLKHAQIAGELDPSPGRERAIASNRFGIALLDARGRVLARNTSVIDCYSREPAIALTARRLSGEPMPELVLRSTAVAHCGEFKQWYALRRDGDELAVVLELDEGGSRGCNVWESDDWVTITSRPGIVVHDERGRHRRSYEDNWERMKPWEYHRDRTVWRYDPRTRRFVEQ